MELNRILYKVQKSFFFAALKLFTHRDALLAQLVEHEILDFRVLSLRPTLGVEPTFKKKL